MTIVDKSVERLSMESALHTLVTMEDCGAGNGGLREKLLSLEKKLARSSEAKVPLSMRFLGLKSCQQAFFRRLL